MVNIFLWKLKLTQFSEQVSVGTKPVTHQYGDEIFLGTFDNTKVKLTYHYE